MLKLKLQYFGQLMWRVDSLEKILIMGGIGGWRRRGWQRMRWLDGITHGRESEWTPGVGDGQGGLACCNLWGHKESDMTERLNWTDTGIWSQAYVNSPESVFLTNAHHAAAAAKLLPSCPTLCDPIDGSPPGSPVPGILQARTLEWAAISFSNAWKWKVKVKSLSRVGLLATP